MSALLHVYDWPSLLIEIGLVALVPLVWWFNRWYVKKYGATQGLHTSTRYRGPHGGRTGRGGGGQGQMTNTNGAPMIGATDIFGKPYGSRRSRWS